MNNHILLKTVDGSNLDDRQHIDFNVICVTQRKIETNAE